MNITILGCNGFLSTSIAKYANDKGWHLDMYGLDEPQGHTYDSFIQCNLMDNDLDCSSLLKSDLVVYAIGAGIQANLKEGFNLIYNLNVTAPITICNKLKELDYKGVFVTFGSYFEMGEINEEQQFTEKDILTTIAKAPSDYVVSKRMLSRFVDSYSHIFTHWHFILPTIYGPGENPKRLIPYTVNAIRNNERLQFTAGHQVRQYIHVLDIPEIIDCAFTNKLSSGIYNIEGSETFSVREIVNLIHNAMGKPMSPNCFGTVQRSDTLMNYLALSGNKLKAFINYKSSRTIEGTIKDY